MFYKVANLLQAKAKLNAIVMGDDAIKKQAWATFVGEHPELQQFSKERIPPFSTKLNGSAGDNATNTEGSGKLRISWVQGLM